MSREVTALGAVPEPAIALPRDFPAQDRQALAELIDQCAGGNDSERQLTACETPETLGLLA